MSVATIKLPKLHAGQRQVKREAKRFNVLAMGRRWGKSTLGLDLITHPALQGHPVGWYAPTNKALGAIWELAKRTYRPIITRTQEGDHALELSSGGKIEMWSLQDQKTADAGRGRKYKRIAIDEAAHVACLEYAWQNVIRPSLTDMIGDAWFYSSPAGVNYFKTLWDRGQDPFRPTWMSWQMPSTSNPFMAPEEIEDARADLTELAFAQEYLAQFVTWEGVVFRKIRDAIDDAIETAPIPDDNYVIACDWGQMNDFNVFLVMNATKLRVVEIDRSRGQEYRLQRGRLAALREKWTIRGGQPPVVRSQPTVIAELNSMGQPVIEEIRASGIPVIAFTTTNASKSEIILDLALAFEQGIIRIPSNPVLLGELQQFEGKRLAGGLMRYEAPSGQHDDIVIALAIAYRMAKRDVTRRIPISIGQLTRESPWGSGDGIDYASRW